MIKQFYIFRNLKDNILRVIENKSGQLHNWAWDKRWKKRDPELNKISIWTYYKGAKRDPGLDAGSTTVAYLPGKGWFWYIPLEGDIVSVGIVAERDYLYQDTRDLSEIFARELKNNLWIEEHLECVNNSGSIGLPANTLTVLNFAQLMAYYLPAMLTLSLTRYSHQEFSLL